MRYKIKQSKTEKLWSVLSCRKKWDVHRKKNVVKVSIGSLRKKQTQL